jgi:hypothetical protein
LNSEGLKIAALYQHPKLNKLVVEMVILNASYPQPPGKISLINDKFDLNFWLDLAGEG